jgi:hypothetical protein
LVYTGDSALLDTCLDMKEALARWRAKPESFKLNTYTGRIYGREQSFVLPYAIEELENSLKINEDFLAYVIHQARVKLISDIAL